MTADAHAHPSPEAVAALRAREPDAILIFRVGEGTYAAYGPDAARLYRLTGLGPGSVMSIDADGPSIVLPAACLEPALAAIVADGRRAAVCEPARGAPRGVPVERAVMTDVADRWEC